MGTYRIIGTKFKVTARILCDRVYRNKHRTEKYLAVIEEKLKEANKLADGVIWTTIEQVYETRWDCPTERLAAAN